MLISYGPLCTEVYDLTKPVGGSYPDVAYYTRRLTQVRGRVLEAAAGTGRLLVPLLQAGVDADGIDSSEHMLAYCRRNCAAHGLAPRLHTGLLQEMDLPERYHAIVIALGSFMLLEEHAAAARALARFAAHLVPGGKLFLDVDVPSFEPGRAGVVQLLRVVEARDGSVITVEGSTTYDIAEQVETTILRYQRLRAGTVVEAELQRFALRWYGKYELGSLLREAGFTDVELCADFVEGAAPSEGTRSLCFTATRA